MGWTNPWVLAGLIGGVAMLVLFGFIEARVAEPMFPLGLFRIRGVRLRQRRHLLGSIARGGLQFMLIIWLQGIWLPLHGYDYEDTPLWAGIYLLPLTVGFLVAGPISGHLSDKFGPRLFAAGGLLVMAGSFVGLLILPTDFTYWAFAALIFLNGLGGGLFAAPNTSLVMSSVPAHLRGAASGMRATFQNAGMVLSIGVFFSLMVAGLAGSLPHTLDAGLTAQGVPPGAAARDRRDCRRSARCSPRSSATTRSRPLLGPKILGAAAGRQRADADRAGVLPAPDLRPVPRRPGHRVLAGDRDGRRRCAGVADPREPPAAARALGGRGGGATSGAGGLSADAILDTNGRPSGPSCPRFTAHQGEGTTSPKLWPPGPLETTTSGKLWPLESAEGTTSPELWRRACRRGPGSGGALRRSGVWRERRSRPRRTRVI